MKKFFAIAFLAAFTVACEPKAGDATTTTEDTTKKEAAVDTTKQEAAADTTKKEAAADTTKKP